MTATARQISEGDLRRRIAGASSTDELGQLATTLNSMIARLHDTADRERRFTSDASHELRTPLAAIEASIDVTLTHERTTVEYRRVLGVVRQQTQRLHTLARQLLLLSRLDAADVRAQAGFARLELTGLVEAVVASFRASQPLTTVRVVTPSALHQLEVVGDLELLARALHNLLDNAARYAGPTVCVTVSVQRQPDGMAVITVEDNGPGVADDLAPEVFQRFQRGDTARLSAGSGLGLAIVAAILRAHGGAARLAPARAGTGARFELTLPLVNAG